MKKTFLFTLFLCCAIFSTSFAQLTLAPSGNNQKSVVTQYIGALVHVTVTYNSPDVTSPQGDDRTGKIWGQLVPYGLNNLGFGTSTAAPWRAGANENTVIKFSHDVTIQGKPLAAGSYGFHIIPQETGPWTLIFSNKTTAWGSYFYDEKDDALRVEASPEKGDFHEWLSYEFIDRQATSATCALMWENIKLPFKIEVPKMNDYYASNIKNELENAPGFNYQSWNAAANWSLQNDYDLEQGLKWAEAAISAPFVGVENFTTLQTKAAILDKMAKKEEANAILDKAIKHGSATPFQIHGYGRQLIAQGKKDKALEVFQYNHKRFEGAWPTEVGMARGLSAVGKYKEATTHAKIAAKQAPDQLNKDSMASAIEKLSKGEDIN